MDPLQRRIGVGNGDCRPLPPEVLDTVTDMNFRTALARLYPDALARLQTDLQKKQDSCAP